MVFPRAFFCATVITFGVCSANISFDHLNLNIFDDNRTHLVESLVPISFKSTEKFFANRNIAPLIASIETSALDSVTPFVGKLGGLSLVLRNIVAKDGDWIESFGRAIANDSRGGLALNDIHWMQAAIDLLQSKVIDLDDSNADYNVFRKRIASFMHSDLDKMVNLFAHQYSIFKKFPLIGAPIFIELSLLIATFSPIAFQLVPLEAKNPPIACKALHTLLDYRPRTVSARLDKIHSNSTSFVSRLAAVRQLPYNPYGYNKATTLQCQRVDESRPFLPLNNSLWDEFGLYIPYDNDQSCFSDYASHVRHKVEELFPIRLLEKVCNERKSNVSTGKLILNEVILFTISVISFFIRLYSYFIKNMDGLQFKSKTFVRMCYSMDRAVMFHLPAYVIRM